MVLIDQSAALLVKGYAWLPDLRRRSGGTPVRTRVMGQPAVAVEGEEAARFFYASGHLERHTALPEPVTGTLFGKGAVQTLDGAVHRVRKAMFVSLLMGDGVTNLAEQTGAAFDRAAKTWQGSTVTLFDETAKVIAGSVTRWAQIPVTDDEVPDLAADLVAMVDGFATGGPRHWRARRARGRRERWLAGQPLLTGRGLDPRVAAVEMLNIIRPSTAVTWLVSFAAHALHRWPEHREPLAAGDDAFTAAFVHEVRRFDPFAPFLGGRAVRDLIFDGVEIPHGSLVLLDVYGQNHDERLWPDPYAFRPERFIDKQPGEFDLIPQGGGDPRTGHRCPGEQITVALLGTLAQRLARLDHRLPPQDLTIDLSRIPARPRSGIRITVG